MSEVMTTSTTADNLWAIHEITSVIHRYCRASDRIDAELGYSVWHEGSTVDYGAGFKGTGPEFTDYACEYHRRVSLPRRRNILIALDGERATSETYVVARLLEAKGDRFLVTPTTAAGWTGGRDATVCGPSTTILGAGPEEAV